MTPFDFVKAITQTRKNPFESGEITELIEHDYNPFICNKALSFYHDLILIVNEINTRPVSDKKMEFDYLFNMVPSRRRKYSPWIKMEKFDKVEIVKKHYNYSTPKAMDALKLLSDEEIKNIEKLYNTGGVKR